MDALVIGAMAPEEYLHEGGLAALVATRLGLVGLPAIRVETASSSGAAAFHLAVQLVRSGSARRVLALAGEKMSHASTERSTEIMAEVLDRSERRSGLTMPGMAALATLVYGREHGIPWRRLERALATVAVKNHRNGAANPYAHVRKPITVEEYLQSRIVASPLRLFDCAPISDGAAAVVVGVGPGAIRVAGIGQATDTVAIARRATLAHFPATRRAAARAFEMAGLGPEAVTFAEIHDAFTSFELISLEDVGLFPPGTAPGAILAGATELGGRLPVNPSGGLKARGHPVGASGLAQIVELVWQMRETLPEPRRVPRPDVGLALSIGGPGANNFVTLLSREAGRPVAGGHARRVPTPGEDRIRAAPPVTGIARVVAATSVHVTAPGTKAPAHLALVEYSDGARIVARCTRTLAKPGAWVRVVSVGGRFLAEPVKRGRRLRLAVRRLWRKWVPRQSRARGTPSRAA